MKKLSALLLLIGIVAGANGFAQQVEFNYEGRVTVDGIPYSGPGYFKFVLMNDSGVSLWSNDESSVTGEEPEEAVTASVADGVFNVIIGDASIANMAALDATIFNIESDVFLRVWFSDSVDSGFEQLQPDRKITNPTLLGSQSLKVLNLYVNPDTGNDNYPGLRPERPKQTIQAAWDALPPMIRRNATINLADGVYREEVLLTGKTVIGNATIAIVGNELDPSAVRVSGADEGAPTTPVRTAAFHSVRQHNLYVSGIRFEYTKTIIEDPLPTGVGFWVAKGSSVIVNNCRFENNRLGLVVRQGSTADVYDCEFGPGGHSGSWAIWYNMDSGGNVVDCYIHDVYNGISAFRQSVVWVWGTEVANCGAYGVVASFISDLTFQPDVNLISGCNVGVKAARNSVISYANDSTRVQYSGNSTDKEFDTGGLFWN